MTGGGEPIGDEGVLLGHQPGPTRFDRRNVLGQHVGLLPEPDCYSVAAPAVRLGANLMGTDADDSAGARVGAVMAAAKGHRLTMPGGATRSIIDEPVAPPTQGLSTAQRRRWWLRTCESWPSAARRW